MTSKILADTANGDEGLAERIRILAISIASVAIFTWVFTQIVLSSLIPGTAFSQFMLALVALLAAAFLYLSASTRYARICAYVTFCICIGVLAFITSASRIQAGGSWVLFQIIPPLAGLTLREKYASVGIALVSMVVLITTYSLQVTGVFVVNLMLPISLLNYNLSMQIGTLACLSIMTEIMVHKELLALQQTRQAQAETSLQLQRVNELLIEQKRLNNDLEQSLIAIKARDKQLAEEQSQRRELHRTIASMSAPIVPIMEGVAVVPLVGSFDQERLVELEKVVIKGIEKEQIKTPIIDTTGISSVHAQFGQALVGLVRTCQRYTSQVIVVGQTSLVQETARYITDAKLSNIQVIGNLQEAIRYVISLNQAKHRA